MSGEFQRAVEAELTKLRGDKAAVDSHFIAHATDRCIYCGLSSRAILHSDPIPVCDPTPKHEVTGLADLVRDDATLPIHRPFWSRST